jgi:hypothetical protein
MNNLMENHLGKLIIGLFLLMVVLWGIFMWSLDKAIEQEGGLGKSIGHFIKDINEGANP